jgi:hypothetical protein
MESGRTGSTDNAQQETSRSATVHLPEGRWLAQGARQEGNLCTSLAAMRESLHGTLAPVGRRQVPEQSCLRQLFEVAPEAGTLAPLPVAQPRLYRNGHSTMRHARRAALLRGRLLVG